MIFGDFVICFCGEELKLYSVKGKDKMDFIIVFVLGNEVMEMEIEEDEYCFMEFLSF